MLLFTVLFWRLGDATFWDPDEAHYAQTTRELIASGDWLAPYYNDQPFFDKPVLFHLLQALPMQALGPSEAAARLVPALAALAIVATTWWLGVTLASAEVGLTAALLLTVNPSLFALARYAILDTVFTAFLFGGAALVTVAALRDRPRLQYGGYVLIALATLTKGPLALVLCGLTFPIAIIASANARRRLLALRWVVGVVIVTVIAAPWFLYMLRRFDGAFIEGYFLNENLRLFGQPMYQGQPPWWFYLQVIVLGMLPWTGLFVGRLYDDARAVGRRNRPDAFEVVLWSWIAAIVFFFSLSSFKLDHYVFPATPALCLLCARAWTSLRASAPDPATAGARFGSRLIGPMLIVAGVVIGFLIVARLDLPLSALAVPIALMAAGIIVTIRSTVRPRGLPRAPWIALAALGVTYAGLLIWVVPAFEQRKVVPEIARWVAAHAAPHDRVASYRLNRWNTAFRYYVDRHTDVFDAADDARQFFSDPTPFYCTMTAEAYRELVAEGMSLRVVHSREGMWVTSGPALWRERTALTEFVVVTRGD